MSVPAAFAGVILIWSTTPLAIQWSSEGWGFLFAVASRMTLGALLCLLLLMIYRQPFPWHKQARRTYVAAGLGVYGAMLSVYWGAQYIPSGLVAVLFGLNPMVTAVMASLWLKEQSLTFAKIVASLLGLFGVAVIFKADFDTSHLAWQGVIGVLLAVLLHNISAVGVKRIAADLSGLTITAGALVLAAPMYLATWALFSSDSVIQGTWSAAMSVVYLGVVGSVVGFSLYFYVLKKVQANKVALITLVTPVLALLIGMVLNDEYIGPNIIMGTGCILLALVIHQWGDLAIRILIPSRQP
ncbi:DMT family transporter [Kaarinaea lacus]